MKNSAGCKPVGCVDMQSEIELIRTLADGAFHSGEELGRLLGITRAGVWKRLQALKQKYGLEINTVKGRGYRLREPLDLIDKDQVLEHIPAAERPEIDNLHLHSVIDSTNNWMMQRGVEGEPSGAVCLTEYQLAGKGRHGRQWISPFGHNVYLSMLWRFEMAPMQIAGLSLAAAIGVLRTLQTFGCRQAGLKWPNDILWQNRKLAGLLLEVSGEAGGPSQVVIGVGLNTWLGEAGAGIDQPWIDLSSIPNLRPHNRSQLAAGLITELRRVTCEYQSHGLAAFLDEWHQSDLMIGRQVEIRSASQCYRGEHLGVDPSGALKLMIDGDHRLFHAGEVSLRRSEE
jgi:BirA family biotin operon repressor/biotin-[acetyl-CoA-carboxylase] ligase